MILKSYTRDDFQPKISVNLGTGHLRVDTQYSYNYGKIKTSM